MIRTFVAVDFPQDYVEKIARIQSKFKDFNIKPIDPNLIHITLKFLGDVNENKIEQIAGALGEINIPSFDARIGNIGVFPKPQYVKVIWLGAEGNFGELHDNVESVLKPFKFKKDKNTYTAHATLARVKYMPEKDKEAFLRVLGELKNTGIGTFHVDAIKLKKSTLTPGGPIYETLHEVRLK
ncbi:MAG TPA: RNA 2',3'-cyclic phosphodiesterase [Methanosarcinaceae archaeon]|nr:RNA 2',3'-cyclic phosphodiesterase [Methanosarcinaceae archaeon]